jgi:hypothetical protein
MAYQIDFTASNYANRSRRKAFLRFLLLAALVGAAWGVHYVYKTYNEPTLNMKLAEYEAVALPIEKMNAAWDEAVREYDAMVRYYRFLWAANPTNFLGAAADGESLRLGRNFRPLRWTMKTGGECRLDWLYVFDQGDKAQQAHGLEDRVANAVTAVVTVVDGKVDVQGVLHENLLRVNEFNVSAKFSLPDVRAFPAKEKVLADCVGRIAAMREKVQGAKISKGGDVRFGVMTARNIMMKYLEIGKDKPGFPQLAGVVDVAGWIDRADKFIAKNRIPDDPSRAMLKEAWNKVGDARFPWQRFRPLDNDELAAHTRALVSVSDGVKRFKGFLEKRHVDCLKKLEPFVEAYEHNDVFNKPLIESDLNDRVAKAAGISEARISFRDESGAVPAVLVKDDEKFTFTWVRWTFAVGGGADRNKMNAQSAEANADEDPLTLAKLADCVKRALELGPGYVLESLKVDFGADGNVSGAVMEGLLPVKTVESKKEKVKNVD